MDIAASRNMAVNGERTGALAHAAQLWERAIAALDLVSPVLDLGIRALLASVFFKSGMIKVMSWGSTLALFQNEYHVPFLPPALAAYMGTACELGLPVFILLGLGTRAAAIALFVFNIVAVVSYPDLSDVGLKDHQYWGLLMLVLVFHGAGRLSLDHFLARRYFNQ